MGLPEARRRKSIRRWPAIRLGKTPRTNGVPRVVAALPKRTRPRESSTPKLSTSSLRQPGYRRAALGFASRPCDRFAFIEDLRQQATAPAQSERRIDVTFPIDGNLTATPAGAAGEFRQAVLAITQHWKPSSPRAEVKFESLTELRKCPEISACPWRWCGAGSVWRRRAPGGWPAAKRNARQLIASN
jgi:hypothetical protein